MSSTTTTPTPLPTYLYKIVPSSSPIPTTGLLPLALPLSALDASDNFIHLSTTFQLTSTLRRFFSTEPHVIILRIPYARVAPYVKWEDPKGKAPEEGEWSVRERKEYFPHVYGNVEGEGSGGRGLRLGREEVDSRYVWTRGEGEWRDEVGPWEEGMPLL